MTEFTTFITIGNRPGALRDYLSEHYGIPRDRAQSVVDKYWPPTEQGREGHYRAVHRMHHAAKWHAAVCDASSS